MAVHWVFEARLLTIKARQLWDGRLEGGSRFIAGIGQYQTGVQLLEMAAWQGDDLAQAKLWEVRRALKDAEKAVRRWHRGVEHFARTRLGGVAESDRVWLVEHRGIRPWCREVRELARLIVRYDATCALTSIVTEQAHARGIFNPHHESIEDRARRIRRVVDLGYAGGMYVHAQRREARANGGGV